MCGYFGKSYPVVRCDKGEIAVRIVDENDRLCCFLTDVLHDPIELLVLFAFGEQYRRDYQSVNKIKVDKLKYIQFAF